jgi:penicillin-binding protein 2
MSVIHTQRQATIDERQLLVPGLLAIAMVFFIVRLWYVQVVRADALAALGTSTGLDTVTRLAPRGRIVDRNGALLAGVQQNAVVTAVYDVVKDHPESLAEVARLLGVTVESLERPLKEASWDPYVRSVIYVGVSPEAASYIAEAGDRLPGFGVELQPTRVYTEPFALSHVLGYVWKPTEREVKRLREQGIEPQTYVGRAGFEAFYEKALMGKPGAETMAVDPQMRPIRTVSVDRPVPGEEVTMALDLRLQRLAAEQLAGRRGAVVASDPTTGEILCMVSSPGFDIHLYDNGISAANYEKLRDDPAKPMINRAIAGAYPPGSTFKIVTSIAAQLGGVFDEHRRVTCTGGYRLGNRTWTCLGRHGAVDFRAAMAASCNVYFYDLAMRAGQKNLQLAIDLVGIGEKQGIDLPGESSGLAPTPELLARYDKKWQPYDNMNTGIGQGDLALTPIQMLTVASLVANRGKAYRPHLLRATKSRGTIGREEIVSLDLPASFWTAMSEALVRVIEAGTAGQARIEDVHWGGKTGSAQNRREALTHSWFVGVAPMDSPKIAIAVVVEQAGHGGSVAAPIAKEIVSRYLFGNLSRVPEVQSSVRPLANSRSSSDVLESPRSE